jgi:hypothetical protein
MEERPPAEVARRRLIPGVRAGLYVLVVVLTLAGRRTWGDGVALALLGAVAVGASVPFGHPAVRRWQPVAEAVLACLIMLALDPLPEAMLPYLLAPALAAGLFGGFSPAIITSGLAVLTLGLGRFSGDTATSWTSYLGTVSQ